MGERKSEKEAARNGRLVVVVAAAFVVVLLLLILPLAVKQTNVRGCFRRRFCFVLNYCSCPWKMLSGVSDCCCVRESASYESDAASMSDAFPKFVMPEDVVTLFYSGICSLAAVRLLVSVGACVCHASVMDSCQIRALSSE